MFWTICARSAVYSTLGALFGAILKPTITQWTRAFIFASLSQRKVLCAKSICTPDAKSGFHKFATDSPYVTELVDTKAERTVVPCIMSAAFLYQQET